MLTKGSGFTFAAVSNGARIHSLWGYCVNSCLTNSPASGNTYLRYLKVPTRMVLRQSMAPHDIITVSRESAEDGEALDNRTTDAIIFSGVRMLICGAVQNLVPNSAWEAIGSIRRPT